jgi:hypothetical protein
MITPTPENQTNLPPKGLTVGDVPTAYEAAPRHSENRSIGRRMADALQPSQLASLPKKRLVVGLGVLAAAIALPMALHRFHLAQHKRHLKAIGLR